MVPKPGEFHLETAFHPDGRLHPDGLNASLRQQLSDHYAHRIRRRPLDLQAQIRRIFLLQGLQRRHSLLGAVTDLFMTLDGKGAALRQDLMSRLSSSFSRQQMEMLIHWAAQGGQAKDAPTTLSSLLCVPHFQDNCIIRRHRQSCDSDDGTLSEAREYLQHGQIEQARETLEAALLVSPDDSVLATELLTIYQHARALERIHKFGQQLRGRGSRLPESSAWLETVAFLQRDAGE